MKFIKVSSTLLVIIFFLLAAGCSPEVGSDEWCEDMKEKPKKEWSAKEAADYAKHCIFR